MTLIYAVRFGVGGPGCSWADRRWAYYVLLMDGRFQIKPSVLLLDADATRQRRAAHIPTHDWPTHRRFPRRLSKHLMDRLREQMAQNFVSE
jgi:hypothetical protein